MTQKNIWYEGIAFPFVGFNPELMRKAYEEFVVNEEDVLTVTFPKSGTNWLIEILCLIRSKGDATQIQSVPIWVRSPWVETVSGYEDLKTMESPRLVSTHLPIHIFPKSIHTTKAKVIYLMRNPRDVLVSGYYFWNYVKFVENTKSLQEYFELFLDGNVTHLPLFPCLDLGPRHFAFCRLPGLFQLPSILPLLSKLHEEAQASVVFGSWFDHVHGWLSLRDQKNFLLLSYEELKQDTRSTIEKICHFLGEKLEPEEINLVLKNSSFQAMKENKMSNYSLLSEVDLIHEGHGSFMRKGISGDWKNHFTVTQAEKFDKVFKEKMADLPQELFPW
uniref:Sulfotransferase n=1 Tax=Oryctolagus cuniculus TaxID=9986 RepID=U3KN38_RABIT